MTCVTLLRMGVYWSIEACGWVEHVADAVLVVPVQVAPSDDDAAAPAVEELLAEHISLTA